MQMRSLVLIAAAAWLAGCSTVPEVIKSPPPGDVHVGEVRAEPARFVGTDVRWGGSVVTVRNERDATVLQIVARRLDSSGQPRDEDRTEGRFLAKVSGFLDPAVYEKGREVTVRGRVEGVVEETIGEFRYQYPVVAVEHLHLWAPRLPPASTYPYYGPYWWHPAYPWGWPYYWPYYPPYRY
jgi:outer membrane lipoprotein